jgi:hypothetical protein
MPTAVRNLRLLIRVGRIRGSGFCKPPNIQHGKRTICSVNVVNAWTGCGKAVSIPASDIAVFPLLVNTSRTDFQFLIRKKGGMIPNKGHQALP